MIRNSRRRVTKKTPLIPSKKVFAVEYSLLDELRELEIPA
eukprot:CAMPEP_0170558102 /NCGR_PEP_ID=MMETSP0211-20121228/32655_1 /TAXON_ID=311385 /ORGANISM="Pseudokeronopsis sp., Strain OXSARD2" /LENGTH=39 /DNA_ID= /DNA_START= /DNA_END= /DNA_ORIENTATION=